MRKDKPPIAKINVRHAPGVRKGYAKYSERVERRIAIGETFCASVEAFKDGAADTLGERFAAELRAGEAMPDQALALELVARSVKSALAVLTAAESKYIRLGISRTGERRECERVAREELSPRIVQLRRTIDALYGKEEGAWIHGIKGKTRRKPGRVLPQARELLDTLEAERRQPLATARRPIAGSERQSWLCQVKPAHDRLAALIKETERLERTEEYARGVRDLALERFDAVYAEALAFALAVYRLAGSSERAIRKLRPAVERRRLVREAGRERDARAEGRRRAALEPIRSAVKTASSWLRRWPRRVA